ncbi:acyl-CoA dehydrogenase family protein [Streptomyces sp. NBC_01142]|uniref:acyl-CoA dehydrogenase family protein n=1 Tax=Streptomyces sp. NBC_01142 TaxID=2975865 RepID=UPI00225791B9|nr:acyl-CoA dehydrogenase family protein [Streptomyces sp. NBC_01142]MCX4823850.1 acyl-CoA dehydrogenase family protein [Streptomyces sp. NBC_01142]
MDFSFEPADETFRAEARCWLGAHLVGEYAEAAHHGAPGSEHERVEARRAWERELGSGGWIGLGWEEGRYGNRQATLTQQVVWAEEYARAGAPGRVGHIGENLLAPTLIAYGSQEQKDRFLPAVARGEELWCQGYSEPGAGSDLAGVRTAAVRDGDVYRISGQKIWTSLAQDADWCFVLARTEEGSGRPGPRQDGLGRQGPREDGLREQGTREHGLREQRPRHHGLSFLLVPMDQPGRIDVRPIRQMSGTAEFNEVFFDGAAAAAAHVVGGEGNGWRVAMGLLALERGVSTLVQQIGFAEELARVVRIAVGTGAVHDPVLAERLVRQWAELRTMRWNALRTLGGSGEGDPGAPSVAKLLWGGWHQRLGELAMQVRGASAAAGPGDWNSENPYELDALQRLFLFTRADTIYGGSDEIQRNIIAERVLGLPREPR